MYLGPSYLLSPCKFQSLYPIVAVILIFQPRFLIQLNAADFFLRRNNSFFVPRFRFSINIKNFKRLKDFRGAIYHFFGQQKKTWVYFASKDFWSKRVLPKFNLVSIRNQAAIVDDVFCKMWLWRSAVGQMDVNFDCWLIFFKLLLVFRLLLFELLNNYLIFQFPLWCGHLHFGRYNNIWILFLFPFGFFFITYDGVFIFFLDKWLLFFSDSNITF